MGRLRVNPRRGGRAAENPRLLFFHVPASDVVLAERPNDGVPPVEDELAKARLGAEADARVAEDLLGLTGLRLQDDDGGSRLRHATAIPTMTRVGGQVADAPSRRQLKEAGSHIRRSLLAG